MFVNRFAAMVLCGALACHALPAAPAVARAPGPPDPERAWEQHDLRPVERWLAERGANGPEGVEVLRARAWLARRSGDSERALELIGQAIQRAPDSADLRVDRASFRSDLLDAAGPFASLSVARDVRDDLEHAVAVEPEHVDALVALAAFHQQAPGIAGGNEHFAETLMVRLEELAPARFKLRRAMQLAAQERFAQAVDLISQALGMAEDLRPKWFLRKGRWLLELGRHEHARGCFTRALEQAPRFRPALFELGQLAARQGGDPVDGVVMLERYLALPHWPGDPDQALAWLYLGQLRLRLGRDGEARDAFERALELDPGLDRARQGLGDLSA